MPARTNRSATAIVPCRGRRDGKPTALHSAFEAWQLDLVAPLSKKDRWYLQTRTIPPPHVQRVLEERISEAQRIKYPKP